MLTGIDRILQYLPIFEQENYQFSTLTSGNLTGGHFILPQYSYSKEVRDFVDALYAEGFVSFSSWPAWQDEAEKYYSTPELIKTADLETLVKLLSTHIRKERICDGHLNSMLECGHITAILHRLKKVHEDMVK